LDDLILNFQDLAHLCCLMWAHMPVNFCYLLFRFN